MHERLSLLLGVGLLLRDVDTGSAPVVVDDLRVVDGDIRGPPVEFVYGVTPLAHHLCDQTVGDAYGGRGVVHESGLHLLPAGGEFRVRRRRERNDVELVTLAFPRREFAQRTFLATGLLNPPLVPGP